MGRFKRKGSCFFSLLNLAKTVAYLDADENNLAKGALLILRKGETIEGPMIFEQALHTGW